MAQDTIIERRVKRQILTQKGVKVVTAVKVERLTKPPRPPRKRLAIADTTIRDTGEPKPIWGIGPFIDERWA